MFRQLFKEWKHLLGSERAVEAHAEKVGMRHARQEGVKSLARQRVSTGVAHCHRQHHGQTATCQCHRFFGGIKAGFAVQRVENGFKKQQIHTTLNQRHHLLLVGFSQLVECQAPLRRIVHVGADGATFVSRTD